MNKNQKSKPRLSSSLSAMKFMQKAISKGTVMAADHHHQEKQQKQEHQTQQEQEHQTQTTSKPLAPSFTYKNPNEWTLTSTQNTTTSTALSSHSSPLIAKEKSGAQNPARRRRTVDSFLPLLYSADTTEPTARHSFKKKGGDMGDIGMRQDQDDKVDIDVDDKDKDEAAETTTLQAFLDQSTKLYQKAAKRGGTSRNVNASAKMNFIPQKVFSTSQQSKVSKKKKN